MEVPDKNKKISELESENQEEDQSQRGRNDQNLVAIEEQNINIEELDNEIIKTYYFRNTLFLEEDEQAIYLDESEIHGYIDKTQTPLLEMKVAEILEDNNMAVEKFQEYEMLNFYQLGFTIYGHAPKTSTPVTSSTEFNNLKKHTALLMSELGSTFDGLLERLERAYYHKINIPLDFDRKFLQYFRNGYWIFSTAGCQEIIQTLFKRKVFPMHLGNSSLLLDAAFYGYNNFLELALEADIPSTSISTGGLNALHYAAISGNVESLKLILAKTNPKNIDKLNAQGESALMLASARGFLECVKLLHENGASINMASSYLKETPLSLACLNGSEQLVTYLLNSGANMKHINGYGRTPILEAVEGGHIKILDNLIKTTEDIKKQKTTTESPLTLAASKGHKHLVWTLIKRGANIEERNFRNLTPLMEASRNGFLECVKILVDNGADIDRISRNGDCALNLAVRKEHKHIVEYLLSHNAYIENGDPPSLVIAAKKGFYEIVRILLISGAKPNVLDEYLATALEYACEKDHTDIVDILYQYGAHLNAYLSCGLTPVMLAVLHQNIRTVHYLISKNVCLNKVSRNENYTPLILACKQGDFIITELLLCNKADRYKILKNGNFALLTAIKYGHINIVDILLSFHPLGIVNLYTIEMLGLLREVYLYSALAYSCSIGDFSITKMLIKYGAPIERRHNVEESVIHIAQENGFEGIAKYISKFKETCDLKRK